MVSSIFSKVTSIQAKNAIVGAKNSLKSSTEKLASGKKTNRASDDPAAAAIAARVDAHLKEHTQTIKAANDAVSVTRTADSAHDDISKKLLRARELAVQAANGTMNEADRTSIQEEVDGLVEDIDSVSRGTRYNEQALLDGTYSTSIDVGGGENIDIHIDDMGAEALNIDNIDLSTREGAVEAIESIDAAIETVTNSQANLGATRNRFESSIADNTTALLNRAESKSRIEDTDYAMETALLTRAKLKEEATLSVLIKAEELLPKAIYHLIK